MNFFMLDPEFQVTKNFFTVNTRTCRHPASKSAQTWLKLKKVYTLTGAQMSLAGKAEVQPCPVA